MKKFFFAAIIAISTITSAFAAETVNRSVLHNFNADFNNATNITWSAKEQFAKATFTVNNVKMEAYYNVQGELVGSAKAVSLDELPVGAKRTFAKKFSGYTVKEVIKMESADDSAFYISAENDTQSVIFKVSDSDQLTTFKRTRK